MKKILITGCAKWTARFFDFLVENEYDYTFVQDERISLKEQKIDANKFEIVICNGLFLYNDIKEFTSLKQILLSSVGFDRVPLDYIKENNIAIYNAKGVYSIPMAEYSVFGVLELYKKAKEFFSLQQNSKWEKQRDIKELFNKTICVVGCGNVGTEVAKRFSAFGCNIVGVDIFSVENSIYNNVYLLKDIQDALKISDVVVLTLPLTNQTENMFDEKLFSVMKDDAVFVNIARGKIVKTDCLIKALKTKLYGAVLDVFEEEPLKEDSELWQMPNVIITPHNSFVGENNIERLEKYIRINLGRDKNDGKKSICIDKEN